eukprot:2283927-Pleurochrysis_carterae.AAC.2
MVQTQKRYHSNLETSEAARRSPDCHGLFRPPGAVTGLREPRRLYCRGSAMRSKAALSRRPK